MPPGQEASQCGGEVTDVRWLTADAALANAREGDMKLPFPTTRNLKNMSEFETIDELMDWADSRITDGITRLCPVKVEVDGKRRWTVWGDPEYPHSEPL